MPYAAEGQISREPLSGGVEITEQQYAAALAGMLAGEHVQLREGALYVGPLPEPEPEPAPEPTPEQLLRAKLQANNTAYTTATMALTADYPEIEKDTWPTQDQEGKAWVADPAGASTPWIDRAAGEREIDREDYLRRTLIKAEQFKVLSSFLTGRRQRYEDAIKAGADPVLDYTLTVDVLLELQRIAETITATPADSLQQVVA